MTNFKQDILQITTRLIVEEGFNYSEAKQKAGSMLRPNKRQKTKLNNFPTNLEIEKSVKEYLQIFYREDLNKRVYFLREMAINLMRELKAFGPILIGELSRDIATEYTILRICVFSDSSKEVLMHFLEIDVNTEVLQLKHPFYSKWVEALGCQWEGHEVIVYCLNHGDKNLCSKGLSINTLQQIIESEARREK
tara:strand:- start:494 stop:1072 length:579 start_codon:yes stop_codon:yes gene_type:complete